MCAVEKGIVAPLELMLGPIAAKIVENPCDLGVLGVEAESSYAERRSPISRSVSPVREDRRIDVHQAPSEVYDLTGTAPVLTELLLCRDAEVVHEADEY